MKPKVDEFIPQNRDIKFWPHHSEQTRLMQTELEVGGRDQSVDNNTAVSLGSRYITVCTVRLSTFQIRMYMLF